MARLILKSPYIKSTGGASGYLRYIATRERVELIPDDRPPTRKQEQLVAKLVKDFPDSKTLYEYEDYLTKPTKVSASTFITLALESNWDAIHESEQYMKYIATRPRAERIGAHGLAQCPRQLVGGTAGRKRHDESDGLGRIGGGLCVGGAGRGTQDGRSGGSQYTAAMRERVHGVSLVVVMKNAAGARQCAPAR